MKFEFKDSCGVGFIVNIKGKKSYSIIDNALRAVSNLTHRGATLADGRTGDGSGILFQIPHEFFIKEAKKIDKALMLKRLQLVLFSLKEK